MPLLQSKKSWITFIAVAFLFLAGWFIFWEVKNKHLGFLEWLLGVVPTSEETKTDFETVLTLAQSLLDTEGEEKTFLILFQNNLELRPGGGFIGSFGILKVRDGEVTHFAVHDTGNFDGRIPDTVPPPYPMQETLRIKSWKFRDSNYSPDFAENVRWAETFYAMGGGTEQFDGVAAITTNVLSSVLKVTGPVAIPGYPGTYGADNAVLDLEYQVEQGYRKQNIDFGERKSFMGLLGNEIIAKVKELSLKKKYELFRVILDDFHRKDIQLSFEDERLQAVVVQAGWSGRMDESWSDDYLFVVDANLGAWKSDYYVKRRYAYTVDLTKPAPEARLEVTYRHTGEEKSWLAKEYQSFLRVYAPKGSFLKNVANQATDPVYGEFLNKKYFGVLVHVPLASEKTVVFEYTLPTTLEKDWYDLKIEKQPGVNDTPVQLKIIKQDGSVEERDIVLNRDTVWSEL